MRFVCFWIGWFPELFLLFRADRCHWGVMANRVYQGPNSGILVLSTVVGPYQMAYRLTGIKNRRVMKGVTTGAFSNETC